MNFGRMDIKSFTNGNEIEYLRTCWDTGAETTLRRKKSKDKGKKDRSILHESREYRFNNQKICISLSRQVHDQIVAICGSSHGRK